MSIHNLCFTVKIRKMYTPVHPRFYRVTDEALIAETAVWPNFFLMNVFFALKGSKLFIITILKWGVRGYTSHGHVILMEGNDSTSDV